MKKNKNTKIFLDKLGEKWLLFNRNSLKISSRQTYKYLMDKHICSSSLCEKPACEITAEDIVSFSDELLASGLSAKTVNGILVMIKAVFNFAKYNYGVTPPYIKYVKDLKKEMRVLSVAEQKKLEVYIKGKADNYSLGVFFALYTGVRVGELCALKWEDIQDGAVRINKTMHRLRDDSGKSVVMIDKPKTESSNRTIPMPDFLEAYVENRRGSDGEFILSRGNLRRIEPRLMQKKFKEITEECGLEGVTFHTLRHTFATRCNECGVDAKTLSEILGHSDVHTTLNKYVHCSLELKKSSMNLLTRIAG